MIHLYDNKRYDSLFYMYSKRLKCLQTLYKHIIYVLKKNIYNHSQHAVQTLHTLRNIYIWWYKKMNKIFISIINVLQMSILCYENVLI